MSEGLSNFGNMMNSEEIFLMLLRAGLWGKAEPCEDQEIDWKEVRRTARKLSVVGLVADGISAQKKVQPSFRTVPEDQKLFIQDIFSIEMSNAKIESLMARAVSILEERGLVPVILKGQGIARNYPVPEHRTSGDIDILLNGDDYRKAAEVLSPLADRLDTEYPRIRHFGMYFGKLEIELHGTVHSYMGRSFNRKLDALQDDLFKDKDFQFFECHGTDIRIPSTAFNAIFIFTHIIQHLYDSGLTLKQICDWAMLLHTKRTAIDRDLLQKRLKDFGIFKEWQVLGCILVDKLGLPADEMPFHDPACSKKAGQLWKAILTSGNSSNHSGHAKENESAVAKKTRKTRRRLSWIANNISISPYNTARAFFGMAVNGISNALHGR